MSDLSDPNDMASAYEQRWLEAQIEEHQYQLNHAVIAFELGRCRNCEEKLDDSRAFCDADCAADFESRQRASKRNSKYRGG